MLGLLLMPRLGKAVGLFVAIAVAPVLRLISRLMVDLTSAHGFSDSCQRTMLLIHEVNVVSFVFSQMGISRHVLLLFSVQLKEYECTL